MGEKERNREKEPNDPDRNERLADTPRPDKERTRLVEQRATNSQTVAFVADQEATIADQAELLEKEHPGFKEFADRARANRDRLQAVVEEERRLATEIQFELADELTMAAQAREHRLELLEVARDEGRLARDLLAREKEDPTVEVMAEQARRNQGLLLHVASTEGQADRALRDAASKQDDDEAAEDEEWAPGTCVTGAGLASGLGIGSTMAVLQAAQAAEGLPELEGDGQRRQG